MTSEPIVIKGIVRHDHCADREAAKRKNPRLGRSHSYSGLFYGEDDVTYLGQGAREVMYRTLERIPDGESITITIERHGKHPTSEGYIYAWIRANEYGRITTEEYEAMVQLELDPKLRGRVTIDDVRK